MFAYRFTLSNLTIAQGSGLPWPQIRRGESLLTLGTANYGVIVGIGAPKYNEISQFCGVGTPPRKLHTCPIVPLKGPIYRAV